LAVAAARGVRVRILTPALNNKPSLARYVRDAAVRYGFEVIRYPDRMNHMKAMVIDDDLLIVGSSNFDAMSYHVFEELVVMTRDPGVRQAFRQRVWAPDTAHDRAPAPRRSLGTLIGYGQIIAGTMIASAIPLRRPEGASAPRRCNQFGTFLMNAPPPDTTAPYTLPSASTATPSGFESFG
jgi:hypothetical protein